MTLRDSIPAALSVPLTRLVAELGTPCRVWRATKGDLQPDNSYETRWEMATPDDVPVVIGTMTAQQKRKDWGDRIEASISGLAMISPVIDTGNLVSPTTGLLRNQFLEVRGAQAIELGGVTVLALEQVPDPRC